VKSWCVRFESPHCWAAEGRRRIQLEANIGHGDGARGGRFYVSRARARHRRAKRSWLLLSAPSGEAAAATQMPARSTKQFPEPGRLVLPLVLKFSAVRSRLSHGRGRRGLARAACSVTATNPCSPAVCTGGRESAPGDLAVLVVDLDLSGNEQNRVADAQGDDSGESDRLRLAAAGCF
jgi:hypothetical protein